MKAFLLACCLLVSVQAAFAQSPAARVKAALAVSQWSRDAVRPESVEPSVATATETVVSRDNRPVVYVYQQPKEQGSCPNCLALALAAERDGQGWPIQFVFREGAPFPVEGYPTLHWTDESGKAWMYTGWPGIERFTKVWKDPAPKPQSGPYAARWTWPGNLSDHLRSTHGANVNGLSQDELERLHDQLHEGVATGNGYCPTGNCPGVKRKRKR